LRHILLFVSRQRDADPLAQANGERSGGALSPVRLAAIHLLFFFRLSRVAEYESLRS
jgi:hypothetical protein